MDSITRKEALRISIRKWSRIVRGLGYTYEPCGFCLYYKPEPRGDPLCNKCPLFPDVCSNTKTDYSLFWRYVRRRDTATAKEILAALRKRGKEWVEQESNGSPKDTPATASLS